MLGLALLARDVHAVKPGVSWSPQPYGAGAPARGAIARRIPTWAPVSVRLEGRYTYPAFEPFDHFVDFRPEFGAPDWRTPTPAGESVPFAVHTVPSAIVPEMLSAAARRLGAGFSVTVDELARADVLSIAIDPLDAAARHLGAPLRAGRVEISRVELRDVFGRVLTRDTAGVSYGLPARLPDPARVAFRNRTPTGEDASEERSPVCGYLLADPIDRAIEPLDVVSVEPAPLEGDQQPA